MKKILSGLLLVVSFASSAAILGLPSEDPIIKNLRERFEAGRAPEAAELLDKTFHCVEMIAREGVFDKTDYSSKLIFTKFDGFLVSHQGTAKMNGKYLVNNGSELIGSTNSPQYMSYRIDTNGYLIGEWTGIKNDITILEPFVTGLPENQKVVSYKICVGE